MSCFSNFWNLGFPDVWPINRVTGASSEWINIGVTKNMSLFFINYPLRSASQPIGTLINTYLMVALRSVGILIRPQHAVKHFIWFVGVGGPLETAVWNWMMTVLKVTSLICLSSATDTLLSYSVWGANYCLVAPAMRPTHYLLSDQTDSWFAPTPV